MVLNLFHRRLPSKHDLKRPAEIRVSATNRSETSPLVGEVSGEQPRGVEKQPKHTSLSELLGTVEESDSDLIRGFKEWALAVEADCRKGSGRRIELAVFEAPFTHMAPYIESAIEIAEEEAARGSAKSHLMETTKELVRTCWGGVQENKDYDLYERIWGIQRLYNDGIGVGGGLPAFDVYFRENKELVFELCVRVGLWKSLRHEIIEKRLLRYLLSTTHVLKAKWSYEGIEAPLHMSLRKESYLCPPASGGDICEDIKRRLGIRVDSDRLSKVRYKYLSKGKYRKSLEQRTAAVGVLIP